MYDRRPDLYLGLGRRNPSVHRESPTLKLSQCYPILESLNSFANERKLLAHLIQARGQVVQDNPMISSIPCNSWSSYNRPVYSESDRSYLQVIYVAGGSWCRIEVRERFFVLFPSRPLAKLAAARVRCRRSKSDKEICGIQGETKDMRHEIRGTLWTAFPRAQVPGQ